MRTSVLVILSLALAASLSGCMSDRLPNPGIPPADEEVVTLPSSLAVADTDLYVRLNNTDNTSITLDVTLDEFERLVPSAHYNIQAYDADGRLGLNRGFYEVAKDRQALSVTAGALHIATGPSSSTVYEPFRPDPAGWQTSVELEPGVTHLLVELTGGSGTLHFTFENGTGDAVVVNEFAVGERYLVTKFADNPDEFDMDLEVFATVGGATMLRAQVETRHAYNRVMVVHMVGAGHHIITASDGARCETVSLLSSVAILGPPGLTTIESTSAQTTFGASGHSVWVRVEDLPFDPPPELPRWCTGEVTIPPI